MTSPISRFPVPELSDLPDDLSERIREVAAKTGFVPNVFLALAHRPAELRAFIAYHDAVMERDGGLSKAEREMIVVATSAARSCPYCVVAHGAILRLRLRDPLVADFVAVNYRLAGLSPRHRAMLDYAVKLSATPEQVENGDLEELRRSGFSDDEVWDISAVVALFALANRMALALDMRPNEEFHLMGRVSKQE
ncbi:MAG: peroxidase-related enzyme [Candidatus Dormibacteria bacterium]